MHGGEKPQLLGARSSLLPGASDGVSYAGLTRGRRRLDVRLARSPSWRPLPRPNSDECAEEEIRRVGMRRVCVERKQDAVTTCARSESALDAANSRPGRVCVVDAKEEKSPGKINALATSPVPGERISDLHLNHAADPLLQPAANPTPAGGGARAGKSTRTQMLSGCGAGRKHGGGEQQEKGREGRRERTRGRSRDGGKERQRG